LEKAVSARGRGGLGKRDQGVCIRGVVGRTFKSSGFLKEKQPEKKFFPKKPGSCRYGWWPRPKEGKEWLEGIRKGKKGVRKKTDIHIKSQGGHLRGVLLPGGGRTRKDRGAKEKASEGKKGPPRGGVPDRRTEEPFLEQSGHRTVGEAKHKNWGKRKRSGKGTRG